MQSLSVSHYVYIVILSFIFKRDACNTEKKWVNVKTLYIQREKLYVTREFFVYATIYENILRTQRQRIFSVKSTRNVKFYFFCVKKKEKKPSRCCEDGCAIKTFFTQ